MIVVHLLLAVFVVGAQQFLSRFGPLGMLCLTFFWLGTRTKDNAWMWYALGSLVLAALFLTPHPGQA